MSKALESMVDEVMRDLSGERIFDLIMDFWEDCCECLDRLEKHMTYKPVYERTTFLFKMNTK
jgi:hypothetical protein